MLKLCTAGSLASFQFHNGSFLFGSQNNPEGAGKELRKLGAERGEFRGHKIIYPWHLFPLLKRISTQRVTNSPVVRFDKNTYNLFPSMQRKPPRARSPDGIAINQRRLMRNLNAIGRIGDRGAVTRLVFSIKELRSRQLLIHLMRQAGLKINIDGIGNIFGRLEGSDRKAP